MSNPLGLPISYTYRQPGRQPRSTPIGMSSYQSKPKVLLFDIGGVCVVSPFQAILDYEKLHRIPVGYINFSIRELTPHGAWHRLERGECANDDAFMAEFKSDCERPDLWRKFHETKLGVPPGGSVPRVPDIDASDLYWGMMSSARQNDPFMYPALLKLKADGRYKLAALSNTTVFPEGHPFAAPRENDVRDLFDIFVSSAHVGMRKPNRDIYEHTLKLMREKWGEEVAGIEAGDVVFLDDIGENLKTGKKVGFRTIRVWLGKTRDAVRELEEYTGMSLLDDGEKAKL